MQQVAVTLNHNLLALAQKNEHGEGIKTRMRYA